MHHRRSVRAPDAYARVVGRQALHYDEGADSAVDRPAYVRSASAIARIGSGYVVVQDDALWLAHLVCRGRGAGELGTAEVQGPSALPVRCWAVPLPSVDGVRLFDGMRGNKARKLDLEACITLPAAFGGRVVAFGSGSTRERERAVSYGLDGEVRVHPIPAFFAVLRAARAFAGSELNLEGAVCMNDRLWLFNRGNGAAGDGTPAVDAVISLDLRAFVALLDDGTEGTVGDLGGEELAALAQRLALGPVTTWDLDAVRSAASSGTDGSVRLTFTDAVHAEGALWYCAAAEASPNAVDDGPVVGAAIGCLPAPEAGGVFPNRCGRYALLTDEQGAPLTQKVEGIAPGVRPGTFLCVVDDDRPTAASEILEVEVGGIADEPAGAR